ncbi:MAG: PEP-CTERM-box response regulator transcription factor [Sphingobium sp.]
MADMRPKLLIVEDDPGLQRQLRWAYDEYQLFIAGDREEAIEFVRTETPDVVTLDLGLPPDPDGTTEGFATLAEILRIKPDTKVIVASGHGARESALHAISGGAYDFYQKPVDIDELRLIVSRAFHVHALERENARLVEQAPVNSHFSAQLITAAPEMLKVIGTIKRIAATNLSVMLLGASGTGKELLAKGVHESSNLASAPFIAMNCAAIPDAVLEQELFGDRKAGKIEAAHGGTLFLDEVSGLSLGLQAKLLRFLEDRAVDRKGAPEPMAVDARIICASNHNLEEMTRDGAFREDLYYRLAQIIITIPALKERPGDATLVAKYFLSQFAPASNPTIQGFAPDALAALDAWGWPGNVRELENRVKRAVIMADGKLITAADLDLPADGDGTELINLRAAREVADRQAIRRAIARSQGNISGAAKLLGISRPTLYDLLKQYEIQA